MNPLISQSDGWAAPHLNCPICGFECTHVDRVAIAARTEDKPVTPILVNGYTGQINLNEPVPQGQTLGEGRRCRIALLGSCENGCSFAIIFTQHKGTTFVETIPW